MGIKSELPIPDVKQQKKLVAFEHEEFLALRAALPDDLRAFVTIAYYTGMRKKEILDLKWEQIDFAQQMIKVLDGKTGNRDRIIFMNAELLMALNEHKTLREKMEPQCSWVICGRTGKRIRDFRYAWRTACMKNCLSGRVFQDLRRAAVRNMVRAGIPEIVTSMITGLRAKPVFARLSPVDENELKKAALSVDRYFERFGKR